MLPHHFNWPASSRCWSRCDLRWEAGLTFFGRDFDSFDSFDKLGRRVISVKYKLLGGELHNTVDWCYFVPMDEYLGQCISPDLGIEELRTKLSIKQEIWWWDLFRLVSAAQCLLWNWWFWFWQRGAGFNVQSLLPTDSPVHPVWSLCGWQNQLHSVSGKLSSLRSTVLYEPRSLRNALIHRCVLAKLFSRSCFGFWPIRSWPTSQLFPAYGCRVQLNYVVQANRKCTV